MGRGARRKRAASRRQVGSIGGLSAAGQLLAQLEIADGMSKINGERQPGQGEGASNAAGAGSTFPSAPVTLTLSKKIGQGGFCSVYLGALSGDSREQPKITAAVKCLLENSTGHRLSRSQLVKSLARELAVHVKLHTAEPNEACRFIIKPAHHKLLELPPNSAGLPAGEFTQPVQCLALEYAEGGSVATVLKRQLISPFKKLFTDLEAFQWCLDIATALNHLHTRSPAIIHRDIKTENVLLAHDEELGRVVAKLGDFGLFVRAQSDPAPYRRIMRRSTRSLRRLQATQSVGGGFNSQTSPNISQPGMAVQSHAFSRHSTDVNGLFLPYNEGLMPDWGRGSQAASAYGDDVSGPQGLNSALPTPYSSRPPSRGAVPHISLPLQACNGASRPTSAVALAAESFGSATAGATNGSSAGRRVVAVLAAAAAADASTPATCTQTTSNNAPACSVGGYGTNGTASSLQLTSDPLSCATTATGGTGSSHSRLLPMNPLATTSVGAASNQQQQQLRDAGIIMMGQGGQRSSGAYNIVAGGNSTGGTPAASRPSSVASVHAALAAGTPPGGSPILATRPSAPIPIGAMSAAAVAAAAAAAAASPVAVPSAAVSIAPPSAPVAVAVAGMGGRSSLHYPSPALPFTPMLGMGYGSALHSIPQSPYGSLNEMAYAGHACNLLLAATAEEESDCSGSRGPTYSPLGSNAEKQMQQQLARAAGSVHSGLVSPRGIAVVSEGGAGSAATNSRRSSAEGRAARAQALSMMGAAHASHSQACKAHHGSNAPGDVNALLSEVSERLSTAFGSVTSDRPSDTAARKPKHEELPHTVLSPTMDEGEDEEGAHDVVVVSLLLAADTAKAPGATEASAAVIALLSKEGVTKAADTAAPIEPSVPAPFARPPVLSIAAAAGGSSCGDDLLRITSMRQRSFTSPSGLSSGPNTSTAPTPTGASLGAAPASQQQAPFALGPVHGPYAPHHRRSSAAASPAHRANAAPRYPNSHGSLARTSSEPMFPLINTAGGAAPATHHSSGTTPSGVTERATAASLITKSRHKHLMGLGMSGGLNNNGAPASGALAWDSTQSAKSSTAGMAGGGYPVSCAGSAAGVGGRTSPYERMSHAQFEQDFAEVFTLTGATGSALYMAPEVFRHEPYNTAIDVFSFAVMMYEILGRTLLAFTQIGTVQPQFSSILSDAGEYASKVAGGYRPPRIKWLPQAAWDLIEACWHEDPLERPTMGQVMLLLQEVIEEVKAAEEAKKANGQAQGCGCTIA